MLLDLLHTHRDTLVSHWLDAVLATYPPQSAQLFKRQRDPFANPVGTTFRTNLTVLFDSMLGREEPEARAKALDAICRIRSVQDFSASRAVGFPFLLKQVVREILNNELTAPEMHGELEELDHAIDRLALEAFDAYMLCREQLADVKVNEARRRTEALVRQLNRRLETSAGEEGGR